MRVITSVKNGMPSNKFLLLATYLIRSAICVDTNYKFNALETYFSHRELCLACWLWIKEDSVSNKWHFERNVCRSEFPNFLDLLMAVETARYLKRQWKRPTVARESSRTFLPYRFNGISHACALSSCHTSRQVSLSERECQRSLRTWLTKWKEAVHSTNFQLV